MAIFESEVITQAILNKILSLVLTMELHFDVVIIGSGIAGLTSALVAADNNLSVIIIEKCSDVGGNSIISGGIISFPQSKEDSSTQLCQDMLRNGEYLNDLSLVQILTARINEAIEWCQNRVGLTFRSQIHHLGGHSVARSKQMGEGKGHHLVNNLLNELKQKKNVKILTNYQVLFLNTDVKNGSLTVTGVTVVNNNMNNEDFSTKTSPQYVIHAIKRIILATGGFGADIEFRKQFNPMLGDDLDTTNVVNANRDGIQLAINIGARTRDMSQIQLLPLTSPDEIGFGKVPGFTLCSAFPHGVLIDPNTSQRFCNELSSRKSRSLSLLSLGHPAIALSDAYGASFNLYGLEDAITAKVIQKFETLTELADCYGMNDDKLKETILRYNSFIQSGYTADIDFGKPFSLSTKSIEVPPFYATRVWPKVHHCMGGLVIDEQARVIEDSTGAPINHLYAAGEVTGGIHGADRLGGCAIADCIVFGRIAAGGQWSKE